MTIRFIGVSLPGAVTRDGIARMAHDAIVFALANPRSEIDPEEIEDLAAVIATELTSLRPAP